MTNFTRGINQIGIFKKSSKILKHLPPPRVKVGVFRMKGPTARPDTRQKGLTRGLILLRLQNMEPKRIPRNFPEGKNSVWRSNQLRISGISSICPDCRGLGLCGVERHGF